MGTSVVHTNNAIQYMIAVYAETQANQREDAGYRQLKPKKDVTKVTAEDAKTLMVELVQFEVDMGEIGVT